MVSQSSLRISGDAGTLWMKAVTLAQVVLIVVAECVIFFFDTSNLYLCWRVGGREKAGQ